MTFCFKKTFLAGLLQPDMQNLEVRTNKWPNSVTLFVDDRNRWFKLPYIVGFRFINVLRITTNEPPTENE